MGKINNIGTYTLAPTTPQATGVYTILKADGVYIIALKLASGGAATYQGAAKIGAFGNSTALALLAEEPTIISSPEPIDNFTITVTSGTVKVITNQ